MKKKLFFLVFITVSVNVFASEWSNWVQNVNLGCGIPIFKVDVSDSVGSSEMKGFGLGLDFKVQAIHDPSGFMCEAGLELGALRVDYLADSDPIWGFDFNGEFGLGYAFVRNERATVSLAGVFGYDLSFLKKKYSLIYDYRLYNVEAKATTMLFFAGLDISGILKLSDSVGIYASCLVGFPLFGFGSASGKLNSMSASETFSVEFGGFYIKPSLGVSFFID